MLHGIGLTIMKNFYFNHVLCFPPQLGQKLVIRNLLVRNECSSLKSCLCLQFLSYQFCLVDFFIVQANEDLNDRGAYKNQSKANGVKVPMLAAPTIHPIPKITATIPLIARPYPPALGISYPSAHLKTSSYWF